MELSSPDLHYVRAALGWLELGDPVEAAAELKHVSARHQNHPDVLDLHWTVCAKAGNWEEAARVAETMVQVVPDQVSGWVNRAYAVRRRPGGGLEQAEAALLPALGKFPSESIVPYNLSCYAAQRGLLDQAWELLQAAIRIDRDRSAITQRALQDDDLKPLWPRLRQLPT